MTEQLKDYLEQEGITHDDVINHEIEQEHTISRTNSKNFIDTNTRNQQKGWMFSYSNIQDFNVAGLAIRCAQEKFLAICTIEAKTKEELLQILKDYTENVSMTLKSSRLNNETEN